MAKVGILNPFFFQIFFLCFDLFYGPFYGWKYTFSLVLKYFVNAPPIQRRCNWRRKKLSGTQKTASIAVTLVLFPNPRYFFSSACFCVRFLGKIMCLRKCWCFLQGWYLCKIERRTVVYIFRKDVYQWINVWTVFLHR